MIDNSKVARLHPINPIGADEQIDLFQIKELPIIINGFNLTLAAIRAEEPKLNDGIQRFRPAIDTTMSINTKFNEIIIQFQEALDSNNFAGCSTIIAGKTYGLLTILKECHREGITCVFDEDEGVLNLTHPFKLHSI
ncbi:MAG: hypothetical protein GY793_00770 [Proteobacteria bacterium]|nr:hypothetical protein [Pseudomonadota bacterium]